MRKQDGCWYCGWSHGDLYWCHEFDTSIHLSCIQKMLERDDPDEGDPELRIIAAEFKDLLDNGRDDLRLFK